MNVHQYWNWCMIFDNRQFYITDLQGCHSLELKKFPDFSLTSKQFSWKSREFPENPVNSLNSKKFPDFSLTLTRTEIFPGFLPNSLTLKNFCFSLTGWQPWSYIYQLMLANNFFKRQMSYFLRVNKSGKCLTIGCFQASNISKECLTLAYASLCNGFE